ncbi:hypothetical protein [Methanolobus profundi]|uniref:Uncharacterized protein n=1 Tax=Methanolobus profundi TaxID=487685 RepID=A0A1I4TWB6_9EURY|nr:hypothetical protein [Methanolobus profundi]SFM80881.1 hypothetical protein SAMN04488696_2488 [Methanolobus profundi]
MKEHTNTKDWLRDNLSFNEDVLISGDSSFSKTLEITPDADVSLRFIANQRRIYGYFLTIQASLDVWNDIEKEIVKTEQTVTTIRMLSGMLNYPIAVLLYDNNNEGSFSVSDDLVRFTKVNDLGLKEYFASIHPELIENVGTIYKKVNRSVNDTFQTWTRNNLSRFLVINDFDIIIPRKSLIIELKRIEEDINSWKPYLDDKSNYLALMKICSLNNLEMKVIAYQEDANKVALHSLKNVYKSKIIGQFVICEIEDVLNGVNVTKGLFTDYESTRRRQK